MRCYFQKRRKLHNLSFIISSISSVQQDPTLVLTRFTNYWGKDWILWKPFASHQTSFNWLKSNRILCYQLCWWSWSIQQPFTTSWIHSRSIAINLQFFSWLLIPITYWILGFKLCHKFNRFTTSNGCYQALFKPWNWISIRSERRKSVTRRSDFKLAHKIRQWNRKYCQKPEREVTEYRVLWHSKCSGNGRSLKDGLLHFKLFLPMLVFVGYN